MRRQRCIIISLLLACVLFSSCGVQKRHYTKGFYSEIFSSETVKFSKHTFPEKLQNNIPAEKIISATQIALEENKISVEENFKQKIIISPSHKKNIISVIPKKENITAKSHDIPDPQLNRVAKAGFRLSIYSLLFLGAGLYLFFELATLFYIVLGVFIIAFIFALVSLLTSIAAGKDRIATNRKGLRFSRFGIIVSLLIIGALAAFFIFTPITI